MRHCFYLRGHEIWIRSVQNNIQLILQFVRMELITQILCEVYALYMNFFVTFETQVQQSTFQNGI
jgi:hypothetical protein